MQPYASVINSASMGAEKRLERGDIRCSLTSITPALADDSRPPMQTWKLAGDRALKPWKRYSGRS
jgi:hypothetical protein